MADKLNAAGLTTGHGQPRHRRRPVDPPRLPHPRPFALRPRRDLVDRGRQSPRLQHRCHLRLDHHRQATARRGAGNRLCIPWTSHTETHCRHRISDPATSPRHARRSTGDNNAGAANHARLTRPAHAVLARTASSQGLTSQHATAGGAYETTVPTVADRIAQTVARLYLEPEVEPIFHPDSYGYRPGRSALDAVAACRQRCWRADWVIDMDIRAFFGTVPWDLVLKAVARHLAPGQQWILL